MAFSLEHANDLLKEAKRRGVSDGDIFVLQGESFEGSVRLKEIEKISDARGKSLTLRLFFGKRHAITSTSDFTLKSLEELITDTCALARISPEDPYAGLPESSVCAKEIPVFDLSDPDAADLSVDEKMQMAIRAEAAAFAADPRITNSEGGSIGNTQTTLLYAATNGFSGTYVGAASSLSVSPIAAQNGQMQRDYWYSTRRKYKDLASAESVGKIAAERTIRRLGGKQIATQTVPVVFDPEMAASLLSHIASAISGYALYKQASFLVDQLGVQIAAENITIYDDPTISQGLGSRPFDGEGLPSYKKPIIEKGILKNYLLDTYSGKKLNLPSTGNAFRGTGSGVSVGTTNFHLMPGSETPLQIIQSVKAGLYLTELIGFGVNTVTGDYSQGAAGLWIENGELTYAVEEITIASNLREMLMNIERVGNDLSPFNRTSAPTLKISQMMIAGGVRVSE
ncbi:MAG: TldD/PmbA family protein [Nitrospirota bacterium]